MEKALEFLKQMRDDTPCEWKELDEAIAELEEAMRPKTCEGCEHEMLDADCFPCSYCTRSYQDRYEPKEKL